MFSIPNSINFTQPKTPIVLISSLNNTNLWLKRNDLTGIELSGNKIRKLDFLLQQAIDEKALGGYPEKQGIQQKSALTVTFNRKR